jgi:hypothetical protein
MRQAEDRHLLPLKDAVCRRQDANDPGDRGPAHVCSRGACPRSCVAHGSHHAHRIQRAGRACRHRGTAQVACTLMNRLARADRPLHQRTCLRLIRAQRPHVAAARPQTHHRRLTHLGHCFTSRRSTTRLLEAARCFVLRFDVLFAISLHDQPPEVSRVGAPRSERCETQGAPPQQLPSDTYPRLLASPTRVLDAPGKYRRTLPNSMTRSQPAGILFGW